MKTLPEDHCRFYAAEILWGLEYLHQNDIVYRNLKPEDVLLDKDGHIKLSDFGLARSTDDITSTFCGEPFYMAPEIITGGTQTVAVDWWSFGILIYEMLVGHTPFRGDTPKDTLQAILSNDVYIPDEVSRDAKNLILKLLNHDPKLRLGWGKFGVNQIKQHKFFRKINWEEIEHKRYPPPYIPNVQRESEIWNVENDTAQGPAAPEKIHSIYQPEASVSNFYFNVSIIISTILLCRQIH